MDTAIPAQEFQKSVNSLLLVVCLVCGERKQILHQEEETAVDVENLDEKSETEEDLETHSCSSAGAPRRKSRVGHHHASFECGVKMLPSLSDDFASVLGGCQVPQELLKLQYSSADLENMTAVGIPPTLFVHPEGISRQEDTGECQICICNKCNQDLDKKLRPLTHFFTGIDPVSTWLRRDPDNIEAQLSLAEKVMTNLVVCKTTIVKLVSWGDPQHAQRSVKGNCITFPQAVPTLQQCLPIPAHEISAQLKVVFVGDKVPEESVLHSLFRVRRHVVKKVIEIRQATHPSYQQVGLREDLSDLPRDDIPDALRRTFTAVQVDEELQGQSYVPDGYQSEDGPDDDKVDETKGASVAMSASGVVDVDGGGIRSDGMLQDILVTRCSETRREKVDITQPAVADAIRRQARVNRSNIAVVPAGGEPVTTWFNWKMWAEAFSHLFPFGLGAGEDPQLNDGTRKLSLQMWVRNLLLRASGAFAQDSAFLFVAYQIMQVRHVCRSTKALTSKKSFLNFSAVAHKITPAMITQSLRDMNKKTKSIWVPSTDPNQNILNTFLRQLRIVGGSIPGSEWEKSRWRHQIMSIMVNKGLPLFFITVNPADLHSPIMMYFAGKTTSISTANLPGREKRCATVASDPVAAARFFHFVICKFLEDLLGKGVLGEVDEYFGTVETQGRGSLHLHLLVWILGARMSEADIAAMFDEDGTSELGRRFTAYVDQCISEYFPDLPVDEKEEEVDSLPAQHEEDSPYGDDGYDYKHGGDDVQLTKPNVLQQATPATTIAEEQTKRKDHISTTTLDLNKDETLDSRELLPKFQFHGRPGKRHNACCYKYGTCTCRFNFPRGLCNETEIEFKDNSLIINIKRNNEWINAFNWTITRSLRCNTDIRLILGGAESASASFYICDYITKKELTTYNALTIIAAALEKFSEQDKHETDRRRSQHHPELTAAQNQSRLMVLKCVNQLNTMSERPGTDVSTHLLGLPMHYTKTTFNNLFLGDAVRTVMAITGLKKHEPRQQADAIHTENANESADGCSEDEYDDGEDLSEDEIGVRWPDDNEANQQDAPGETAVLGHVSGSFVTYSPTDNYVYRPILLHHLSLYDTIASFTCKAIDKKRKSPIHESCLFTASHPNRETHRLTRNTLPLTPQFVGGAFPSYTSTRKLFYFYCSVVFLPFTPESLCDWPVNLAEYEDFFDATIKQLHPPTDQGETNPTSDRIYRCVANIQAIQTGKAQQKARRQEKIEQAANPDTSDPDCLEELSLVQRSQYSALMHSSIDDFLPLQGSAYHTLATKTTNADLEKFCRSTNSAVLTALSTRNLLDRSAAQSCAPASSWSATMRHQIQQSFKVFSKEMKEQDHERWQAMNNPVAQPNVFGPPPPQFPPKHFAKKHGLDEEQTRAFMIMADVFRREQEAEVAQEDPECIEPPKVEQEIAFFGGAGGTGKSHIIKAFTDMVGFYNQRHRVRLVAYTGSAGANIGGTTVDWLIAKEHKSDGKEAEGNLRKSRQMTLELRIGKCRYLIIDEVSMLSAKYLAKIDSRMKQAIGTAEIFGRAHVFFFGDFFQYPPISFNGSPLYKQISSWYQRPAHLPRVSGLSTWNLLTSCVMLKVNHRVKDSRYLRVLNTLRAAGEPAHIADVMDTMPLKEAYDTVSSRVLSPTEPLTNALAATAPFLTPRNHVRHSLTAAYIKSVSALNCCPPLVIPARDSYKKEEGKMDSKTRIFLQTLTDSDSGCQMGQLVLVPNMWLCLNYNMAVCLGLYNGTLCQLCGIVPHEEEPEIPTTGTRPHFLKYLPQHIFVKVHKKIDEEYTFTPIGGLPAGVIMVTPVDRACIYPKNLTPVQKLQRKQYKWNRLQLPVGPALSFTGYKVQGRTLTGGMIDLRPPPGGGGSTEDKYVFLSRFTKLTDFDITAAFPQAALQPEYSDDFKKHQEWLHKLHDATLARTSTAIKDSQMSKLIPRTKPC